MTDSLYRKSARIPVRRQPVSLFGASVLAAVAVLGANVALAPALAATHAEEAKALPAPAAPAAIRRLTQDQYRNIIADVFGTDIDLGGRFEPDLRADGLIAIGSAQASVTASGMEQFDRMGRAIGRQVVDARHRDALMPCKPARTTAPDDACSRKFLSEVGLLLFRRPLTGDELQPFVASAAAATGKTGDFYQALGMSLGGLLAAPQFLYRIEAAEPDPGHPGTLRLTAYSLAERLSFFLWNTLPDPQLLAAAKSGELHTSKGLAKQVDRMLASPRLEAGVRAFFTDLLQFDTFDALAKDDTRYPKFTAAASREAQEQTLRTIVDLLVRERGDFRDLFTTRKTELTTRLGSLYGVAVPPRDGVFDAWVPYEFAPESGQAGILTHVSFVGLHSHPARTSPTIRGKALREILMCQKVPDPPGNVDFKLVQDTANQQYKTVRQRLGAHATEPMCKGCHKVTDPIGLALENFDTIGGFRATENGASIDTSGEVDGVKFTGAVGLGAALHDNRSVQACLVKRVYAYGLGRSPSKEATTWLADVVQQNFAAEGYQLPGLLRQMATSEAFTRVLPAAAVSAQSATAAAAP